MKKTKHKSWVTVLDEKSYINFFISHLGEKKMDNGCYHAIKYENACCDSFW